MDSGDILFVLTFAGALGAGLVAGVFYAFSSFVMPGLRRITPAEGLRAMQSINVTAVMPAFMAGFMGTTALSVVLVAWGLVDWGDSHAGWLLAGGLLYLIGSFALTASYQVPRNNALNELDSASTDSHERWRAYDRAWTAGNHVRALAAAGAMACYVAGLLEMA